MKFRKAVSVVLLFSLFICLFTPVLSVSANTPHSVDDASKITTNDNNSNASGNLTSYKRTATTYSCTYDNKQKQINVNGSVSHEVFVEHRDYALNLYKIDINTSLDTVLKKSKPLASTEISIKFNFVVNVETVMDILSQYVVVLVSPSGTPEFVGSELFPSVKSETVSDIDRNLYKGIEVSSASVALQSAPSVAIIPINLSKLVSSGYTGYLYSFEDINIFFDKQYIDQLDICVRNLSSLGTQIYFRLLFEPDEASNGKEYSIPNLYSKDITNKLYAYCDFLSSRYSSYKYGYISGMVIGKNLDDVELCNDSPVNNQDAYSKLLAYYGMTVGIAIRNHIPAADVVYSFSNVNSYFGSNESSIRKISPSDILEDLCEYFDEYYSGDFDFSITVESAILPLNIANFEDDKYIDISVPNDDNYITEANIEIISDYVDELEKKYESFPHNFMYVWEPGENISSTALSCAYSYLYYKLFHTDKLSAFVVSFEKNSDSAYDVLSIIKYIDTQNGVDFTSPLLEFFYKASWSEIISGFNKEDYLHRYHKLFSTLAALPTGLKGRFSYLDLAKSADKSGWFAGNGSSSLEMYNSDKLGRVLSANMKFDAEATEEYAHLFYSYEYCENFVYTPYVAIRFSIESEKRLSEIFELKVSFIDSNNVYEFSQIVYTDEDSYIYLDLSEFSTKYMADYVQFSLRPMAESVGDYKLLIASVEGFSTKYNNDELEDLISSERLRIRNLEAEKDSDDKNDMSVFIIIAVVLVAGIIAVMLFFFLRRDDSTDIDENQKE